MKTGQVQLIDELVALRQRIAELEKSETELKQAEESLWKSEARYRSLVEGTAAGVAIIDPEGRLIYFNISICRMTGYSEEELFGQAFTNFIHPDDKEKVIQVFQQASTQPQGKFDLEFRVIHKKGHIVHLHSSPTILKYGDKIAGFTAIMTESTWQKKMEQQTKELQE